MKKLSILLSLLLFCSATVMADEVEATANQETNLEGNKAVVSVQKQPTDENSKQKQDVKNNWFCIVIQVNGKALDTAVPVAEQ